MLVKSGLVDFDVFPTWNSAYSSILFQIWQYSEFDTGHVYSNLGLILNFVEEDGVKME